MHERELTVQFVFLSFGFVCDFDLYFAWFVLVMLLFLVLLWLLLLLSCLYFQQQLIEIALSIKTSRHVNVLGSTGKKYLRAKLAPHATKLVC